MDLEYLEEVLDLAVDAGSLFLQNGSEVSRARRKVRQILQAYGVETMDFSIQLDSIIIAVDHVTKVRKVPVKGNNLGCVIALNQLANEISEKKYTLEEAAVRLEEIKDGKGFSPWVQIPAAGLMSGSFTIMVGGTAMDFAAAFLAGMIVWGYVVFFSSRWLGKYFGHISNGAVVACVSLLITKLGLGDDLHCVIIGVFMILTPGLSFIHGFRDFAEGYYESGLIRLIDASFIFISMVIGADFTVIAYNQFFGGVVLL